MADGFLGRWSRRKLDERQEKAAPLQPGAALPEPVIAAQAAIHAANANPLATAPGEAGVDPGLRGDDKPEAAGVAPTPTLDDAHALTSSSDFKPFMARGVTPEIKNAAMKKLFADPHFNVMDRLDTYIDDYSQPDPIPAAMLRQLASAKFLRLFDDEQDQDKDGTRDVADNPAPQSVAQSDATQEGHPPPHADPDLRLQSDHAPPGKDPGSGTQ